ncbi:MAG: hypothetical protein MSB10_03265 [Clostridiales bacterium]|uniref:hypothetical protein n=1 Tax=Flavonifractor porci TaxID=3133422 RepID=UPI0030AFEB2E|nr:hypothetical protein [Clostridiales bacterium]
MAQLEEQLNQILGNPQAMEQIMSLAQSLSGKQEDQASEQPAAEPESETAAQPPTESDAPSPLSALDGLDPRLLQMGMGLLSEYSAQDDKKTALLAALKPFLKPERQEKMDQAVRIARLTRVIRTALRMFRDRGEEEDDV